uniref:WGR domain-containing protein n=1 Tax=Paracidovorax oryzae TaxID=862720 RepID=UPI00037B260F
MRRFELIEGSSSKFWEVEQAGSGLNIRWGRIGTAGQSQTKAFADAAKATAAMARLVTEKTGKGYAEVGVAPGAAIGASPAPAPAKPAPAKPPSPGTPTGDAPDAAPVASAQGVAAAPAEGLDAQCERAVAATWAQIAEGSLKVDDVLSAAVIKRRHGVSDQGAAMAFEQLKSAGLLQGWGTTAQVSRRAQERARALIADAAARAAQAASTAETPAISVAATGDGGTPVPPWLAQGDPVRLSPQMEREAYATRRFPPPVQAVPLAEAWQRARGALDVQLDLPGTDAALRDVLQRMSDRLARTAPQPDAEADTVLLALALSMSGYHGENAGGAAIVDYLVAQYGLPGAVDILIAAQRIKVTGVYDSQAQQRRLQLSGAVTHPMSNGWRGPLGQGEETFRNYLAAAPQAEWEACADRIEAALPSLPPSRQPVMALLLPDRPALSDALAPRLAAEKETPETAHWLLLTAQDPAALAIAARTRLSYSSGFWGHGRMVATAVRERGCAAVAVLERGAADEAAGEALAAIGTPEAVLALAKVASSSKGALARLSLAVDRWPLAGIVALSRLVAADGKDAGLLTPTLSRLLRAHGESVPPLRPWLDAAAQTAVDRQL